MSYHYKKLFVVMSLVIFSIVGASILSAQDMTTVEVPFVNHIVAGMPEPDVLVETDDGAVMRVSVGDPISLLGAPVYTSTSGAEHDMFMLGENPLGPYEMGEPLGMTLGQWLSASGSATLSIDGDTMTIDANLSNMVPDGVYTAWCSFVFVPPNFSIENHPCGAADGSENVVTADAEGNLSFSIQTETMSGSTDEFVSVIALAYHSDGQTYGADPGNFGEISHVHLFAPLPPME